MLLYEAADHDLVDAKNIENILGITRQDLKDMDLYRSGRKNNHTTICFFCNI